MNTYQVVFTNKGRKDDMILQADSSAEAKTIVKMDYSQAVIISVKKVA